MKNILQTILVFLAAASIATAGTWWEKVSDISVSEDGRLANLQGSLYLYDLGKVYRSADNGATWTDLSKTFPNGVYAFRHIGSYTYAFTPADASGRVTVFRSEDAAQTWHSISQFEIASGRSLRDVSVEGTNLYAITDGNTILASWDHGQSWTKSTVTEPIGGLTDLATSNGLWIACGTEGAAWSADNGTSWYQTFAPLEVGSGITQVEAFGGTIWAGGNLGACRFDMMSRSWQAVNEGLPVFASLVASPLTFRAIGGVLFGVFKTFNGQVRLLRLANGASSWVQMESAGLPPHNLASYDNFTVVKENVFLYYYGNDIGFVGIYKGLNDAPTSVENDVRESDVTVGPNPAIDRVHVSTASSTETVFSLMDVSGRELATQRAVGDADFNVSAFAPGVYFIRVTDVRGSTTKPIVISQ